jgi:hypothetical protein
MTGATQGTPSYTGPTSQFPSGPLSNVESFGAGQAHSETPGAVAGALRGELTTGTLVRSGGSIESHGIGVNANHTA